jgi:hypothetical protein
VWPWERKGRCWRLKKGPDKRGPLFSECERERGERLEWAGEALWAGSGNGPRRGRLGRSGEKEGEEEDGPAACLGQE